MKQAIGVLLPFFLLGCHGSTPVPREERNEQLIGTLAEIQELYNIPAVGAIVLNSEGIIDAAVTGVRETGQEDPATVDDYFHLGSNTKAITAFVAARLVEDGLLEWSSKLFDVVPELATDARPDYAEVTLAELLSHRAWVRPFVDGREMAGIPALEGDASAQRLEFSHYVLREKPAHWSSQSRFRRYAYSNAGYILAAVMMERAANASWESLIAQVIERDLGLRARIGFPIEAGPNQPRGHLPGAYLGEDKDVLVVYDIEYVLTHEEVMNPAGDLSMSMTEYAELIRLHLRGLRGEDNYLPSETYEYMHFGVDQYAMGWENGSKGGERFSEHSGSRGNFFCHVRILPEEDLAIIAFANSGILNALKPLSYLVGGIRLERYLGRIERLYIE
jgi:D-alanyl-D-alanine carboxypeptidase